MNYFIQYIAFESHAISTIRLENASKRKIAELKRELAYAWATIYKEGTWHWVTPEGFYPREFAFDE